MTSIAIAIFLLIAAGIALSTATLEWGEVRDDFRARMVRRMLGDAGARAFYIVVGVALVALAVGVVWARFVAS